MSETHFLAKVNEVRGAVILDNVRANTERSIDNSTKLDALTNVAKVNSDALNDINDAVKDNSDALNSLSSMLKGQFLDIVKYAECKRRLVIPFKWNVLNNIGYATKVAQEMHSKLTIRAAPMPIITLDQLMPLLQIDPELSGRDTDMALRQGNLLRPTDQQRAAWLMSNSKFRSWFQSGYSEMLVIDGMGEMLPISPMSYFCSLLSHELSEITNAVPLTFFCGMHARANDYMTDATALMRSLCAQVLSHPYIQQQLDLSFLSLDAINGIQSHRLDYLTELFRHTLLSLSSSPSTTTIFAFIDGISFFETSSRRNDTWFVVQNLTNLVFELNNMFSSSLGAARGGVIFKLLVTSPKASLHVKHVFPRDKQLVVTSERVGNGGGFNASQMAMEQQRLLGSASSFSSQVGFLFSLSQGSFWGPS